MLLDKDDQKIKLSSRVLSFSFRPSEAHVARSNP
jgi:hypothetical protein